MGFIKVNKNKAYFMRYQTKFRRRRECKTDYYARKRLVAQSKNKYNMPKYRFVVRFTNKYVICQIIYATLKGDKVLCQAHSQELPRYGVEAGLKNFPAAYCTGLLLARRLLKQLKLDETYTGVEEVNGEVNIHEEGKKKYYVVADQFDEEHRPFRANLDVGLKIVSSGSKIFAALKGASDGGLDIPHSTNLFPGFLKGETKAQNKFDAETFADKIKGSDVAGYMEYLVEEDEVMFKRQFAKFHQAEVTHDGLEEYYTDAHAKIREDPTPAAKKPKSKGKRPQTKKITYAERKERVKAKLAKYL